MRVYSMPKALSVGSETSLERISVPLGHPHARRHLVPLTYHPCFIQTQAMAGVLSTARRTGRAGGYG